MVDINRDLVGVLNANDYTPIGKETHDGPGWSIWQNRVPNLLADLFPVDAE